MQARRRARVQDVKLCEQRKALLGAGGHLLVLGGPGSGKTTIALIKGATEVSALAPGQKILFLSFARATVARIVQESRVRVPREARSKIELNTYHGFVWEFNRGHGYLLTGHRSLRLLPPPDAAGKLAGIAKDDRPAELQRLLDEDGLLGFDLFAGLAADLLEQSPRLCRMLADCYPVIILDEFQDTNLDEWRMIAAVGQHSRLIALADAEQRIYEFRGADPARIDQFIERFDPKIFDFAKENNRSDGTDIVDFGNDVLTGANVGKAYTHVTVSRYNYYKDEPLSPVKHAALAARQRLYPNGGDGWSLAILVKSRDMMLKVSSYLGSAGRLPEIAHDVLTDPEGPALAAVLIAGLLEGAPHADELKKGLLRDVINHIRGRNGGDISKADLTLADALAAHQNGAPLRGGMRAALMADIEAIAAARMGLVLTGDPEADWLAVRRLIDDAAHDKLKLVADDARFIRLLNRGTQLRENLIARWRAGGSYVGARDIVSGALLQEHFSASTRVWAGVNVMTIHKSKGKEFDEVIVFEGSRAGRLLRDNANASDLEQARLSLRVAVTRARKRTTILTPAWASSTLLC
jgi:DNA helicase II / ATP-dependent DNA helicase PcrA